MVWFEAGWERWVVCAVVCAPFIRKQWTALSCSGVDDCLFVCLSVCLLMSFARCCLRMQSSSISSVIWVDKASQIPMKCWFLVAFATLSPFRRAPQSHNAHPCVAYTAYIQYRTLYEA
jgi:hypothetical protein